MADIERLLFLADGRLVVRTDDGDVREASAEESAGVPQDLAAPPSDVAAFVAPE